MAKWGAEVRDDNTVGILVQRAPGVVVGFPVELSADPAVMANRIAVALDALEPADDPA